MAKHTFQLNGKPVTVDVEPTTSASCGCCATCSGSPAPSTAAASTSARPARRTSTARRSTPARSGSRTSSRPTRSRRSRVCPATVGRRPAPDAGGLAGPRRRPVRLLPARPDHGGGRAGAQGARPRAARSPTPTSTPSATSAAAAPTSASARPSETARSTCSFGAGRRPAVGRRPTDGRAPFWPRPSADDPLHVSWDFLAETRAIGTYRPLRLVHLLLETGHRVEPGAATRENHDECSDCGRRRDVRDRDDRQRAGSDARASRAGVHDERRRTGRRGAEPSRALRAFTGHVALPLTGSPVTVEPHPEHPAVRGAPPQI